MMTSEDIYGQITNMIDESRVVTYRTIANKFPGCDTNQAKQILFDISQLDEMKNVNVIYFLSGLSNDVIVSKCVTKECLEEAKSQLTVVTSIHIYAILPHSGNDDAATIPNKIWNTAHQESIHLLRSDNRRFKTNSSSSIELSTGTVSLRDGPSLPPVDAVPVPVLPKRVLGDSSNVGSGSTVKRASSIADHTSSNPSKKTKMEPSKSAPEKIKPPEKPKANPWGNSSLKKSSSAPAAGKADAPIDIDDDDAVLREMLEEDERQVKRPRRVVDESSDESEHTDAMEMENNDVEEPAPSATDVPVSTNSAMDIDGHDNHQTESNSVDLTSPSKEHAPAVTSSAVVSSTAPSTAVQKSFMGGKKNKKKVVRETEDEDGFTITEEVWVTDDEGQGQGQGEGEPLPTVKREAETKAVAPLSAVSSVVVTKKAEAKADVKKEKKPKLSPDDDDMTSISKAKAVSSGKSKVSDGKKQSSMLSFFGKK